MERYAARVVISTLSGDHWCRREDAAQALKERPRFLIVRDGYVTEQLLQETPTMKGKQLHDFLFALFDYADTIAEMIQPETQGSAGEREQAHYANTRYFLTLVYVEWIFDKYARETLYVAAKESGELDPSATLQEANRRLDLLRQRLDHLTHEYDFDADIDGTLDKLAGEWRTAERGTSAPAATSIEPSAQ